MNAKDLSSQFTAIRQNVQQIVGVDGILGKLMILRAQLDSLQVLKPYTADNPTVEAGPNMPPPDSTAPDATDVQKPWSFPEQGENKKFAHPDDVCAIFASLQVLQAAMGQTVTTFKKSDGTTGTTTPMAAFTKVQV